MNNEVIIGNQVWMSENLNVDKFRNGDAIPEVKTDEEWEKAGEKKQPAWCYYNNDPANGEKYGKLYNWYAVNDPRGISPAGWHVPSDEEWKKLVKYVGGADEGGTILKTSRGWSESGYGPDEFGFRGLPGGFRYYFGPFSLIGHGGDWWSSTEDKTYNAWRFGLYYNRGSVSRDASSKAFGFSVRCLRD